MALRRIREIRRPVILRVDGREVVADEGEPMAMALGAAGRAVLSRSVKYHRPRGAACYAGRCDGCLMRVDGVGNTMTCLRGAKDGAVVETQNVLGTAEADLLAVTDWFFPNGIDHHHMFTQFGPLNRAMQKVARRVAGIGRLPDGAHTPRKVLDERADVLVVGGGLAGLSAAAALADRGLHVLLVDEGDALGGIHRDFPDPAVHGSARGAGFVSVEGHPNVRLRLGAVALGVYGAEVLLGTADGLVRVRPRALILAMGTHEGAWPVPGSDLPGVIGARGAARLLRHGFVPGDTVALFGDGPWSPALREAFARHGVHGVGPHPLANLVRIEGSNGVERVVLREGSGEREVPVDAVVVEAPPSAAMELGAQAGLEPFFDGTGFFLPRRSEGPGAGPVTWALGTVTGEGDPARIADDARRIALEVAAHLAAATGAEAEP